MKSLPKESPRYFSVLYALSEAGAFICDFSKENVAKASATLAVELNKKGGTPSLEFFASGHAHLDLAWLWPIRESKRKAARTFATALANIEKYPDYVFGQSQPQQYVWIQQEYPELFKKIKQKIKEGRIEPQGAMWVEADTNISGGEALVRQILYGKQYFKKEFDKDINILHIPDVFGFSAALPQILKKSGVDYMLTIKMSWSWFNTFPHHSFKWVGQDGTEILVHMPPEGTYNSLGYPSSIKYASEKYTEKGISSKALILYGIGDGGGGPGEEHLEGMSRIKNLEGIFPVRQGSTLEFFEELNKESSKLRSFKGEMYLEAHQGTYTTQAKVKYYNRLMEKLLRDAEIACAAAKLFYGEEYPKELEEIWKEVLLYQFHDILPGSSIKRVYDECVLRYVLLEEQTRKIISNALSAKSNYNGLLNTLSWDRTEVVKSGNKWFEVSIPALSSAEILAGNEIKSFKVKAECDTMSNGLLTAVFNDNGGLVSLRTADGFEGITDEANKLNIYCDNHDAWNINPEYLHKPVHRAQLIKAVTYTDGAFAIREQDFEYGNSVFKQIITLKQGSSYLEFENIVDWKESEKMFRIDGNFNIFSDKVVCDVQFGNVTRSTLENNSLDFGQFEISAHKYIDLSNDTQGVALLNDCKYGYRAKGNLLSLNALRSTSHPGADADMGEHRFRYAIYPHDAENNVERLSYEFNFPLLNCEKRINAIIQVDRKEIIVEAIKQSEDGKALIVRLYNNKNASIQAKITVNNKIKAIHLADLMENKTEKLDKVLSFKPYEIHTLILVAE